MKALLLLAIVLGVALADRVYWPRINCGKFDRQSYLNLNPDVARAGVDPLNHYLNNGHTEYRTIGVRDANNRLWTGKWSDLGYQARNMDIDARWDASGWQHFRQFGATENRDICVRTM